MYINLISMSPCILDYYAYLSCLKMQAISILSLQKLKFSVTFILFKHKLNFKDREVGRKYRLPYIM